MGANQPYTGYVVARPADVVDTALATLEETFVGLLEGAAEDAKRILQELEGHLANAIVTGDEEAIEDYEIILSGILEINEIKAKKAVKSAMLTAMTSAAKVGLSLVRSFVA